MNIITREQVNKMVRGLPKKISMREIGKYKRKELYHMVEGEDVFGWYDKDGKDLPMRSMRKVGLPIIIAYRREGMTFTIRGLQLLDDLFYQTINNSDAAKLKGLVSKYNQEYLEGVRKELKYINIFATEYDPEYYLMATFYFKKGVKVPDNANFKQGDGEALGKHAEKFIKAGGYHVKGLEEFSFDNILNLRVKFDTIKEWNEFTRAVIDFDKMLQEGK